MEEVKKSEEEYVELGGDWGGVQYMVCPTRLIQCSEAALRILLEELERLSGDEPEGREFGYHSLMRGEKIRAGSHGGMATGDLWLNQHFKDLGLEATIRAIIGGERPVHPLFRPDFERMILAFTPAGGNARDVEAATISLLIYIGFDAGRIGGRIESETTQHPPSSNGMKAWWRISKRLRPETTPPWPAIVAIHHPRQMTIWIAVATDDAGLIDGLERLRKRMRNEQKSAKKGERRSYPALLCNLRVNAISGDIKKRAVGYGIPLISSERLVEFARACAGGHSSTEVADSFIQLCVGV